VHGRVSKLPPVPEKLVVPKYGVKAKQYSSAWVVGLQQVVVVILLFAVFCVASLALLPAGAQEHVPAAVQHLMDARSPIYDMYETCDGCEAAAVCYRGTDEVQCELL